MCSEAGWTLENAVEHLRSITALACGNPYLIDAVARFLQVEAARLQSWGGFEAMTSDWW